MNTTDLRPEVATFVARVREQLADLTEDEREELVGGLEADLSEQLDAGEPLPDPASYVAELRAAAGLPPAGRRRLSAVAPSLDTLRADWARWTTSHPVAEQAWELAVSVRPAWWVLRAWIAVTLLDQLSGPFEYVGLWPRLGVPLLGPLLLLVAVVVSVLIGQDRLWPGSGPDRRTSARVVLVVLNALAVLAPLTFTGDGSEIAGDAYVMASPVRRADDQALRQGADVVRNIYAYDAQGQPLVGVQLFDQRGRPVAVSPASSMGVGADRSVTCPWLNGTTELFNVYPLRQRTQPFGTCLIDHAKAGEPGFAEPPLASVPPVQLP